MTSRGLWFYSWIYVYSCHFEQLWCCQSFACVMRDDWRHHPPNNNKKWKMMEWQKAYFFPHCQFDSNSKQSTNVTGLQIRDCVREQRRLIIRVCIMVNSFWILPRFRTGHYTNVRVPCILRPRQSCAISVKPSHAITPQPFVIPGFKIQRRLAWSLSKNDTHNQEIKVTFFFKLNPVWTCRVWQWLHLSLRYGDANQKVWGGICK